MIHRIAPDLSQNARRRPTIADLPLRRDDLYGHNAVELQIPLFLSSTTVVPCKYDKQKTTHIISASGCYSSLYWCAQEDLNPQSSDP